MNVSLRKLSRFVPRAASSGSVYWCSALQSLQIRRTKRCATTRFTALATLNASMPMSIIRVMVLGASLVCRVEITDLADHDDVGILPQKGLEGGREGKPDLGAHQNLIDAHEVVLHRVFRRH